MPTAVQHDVVSKSIALREQSQPKVPGSERSSFDDALQTARPKRLEKSSAKPDHPAKKSDKPTNKSAGKAKRTDRKQSEKAVKGADDPEVDAHEASHDQGVSAEQSAEPVAQDGTEVKQVADAKAKVDGKQDDHVASDDAVLAVSASARETRVSDQQPTTKNNEENADVPAQSVARKPPDADKSASSAEKPIAPEVADDRGVAVDSALPADAPTDDVAVKAVSQSAKPAVKLANFGKSIPSDADASSAQAVDCVAPEDAAGAVAAAANLTGNLPDQSSGFSADLDGNSDRDGRTTPISTIASTVDASAGDAPSAAQPKVTPSQSFVAPRIESPAPPPAPDAQFAADNHPRIITGIHGQLLPNGGTMQLRLDPPELGALQVLVHMRDGMMTATFQTANDEATRMLSHSLGDLKHALEASGVTVDKIHVQQSPRDQQSSNDEGKQQGGQQEDAAAKQEQQRRELLNRMWRRLANGSDPLDMVA